jgi:hypothetical protein
LPAFTGLLQQDVATHHSQIAQATGNQPWDVVVTHQQQVDRSAFAIAEQAIAAFTVLATTSWTLTLPPAVPPV